MVDSTIPTIAASVIAFLLTVLNGLALFILVGIRADLKDVWDRMYHHEHMVGCENDKCNIKKTSGVLIPTK
jgi:hypothetical protein